MFLDCNNSPNRSNRLEFSSYRDALLGRTLVVSKIGELDRTGQSVLCSILFEDRGTAHIQHIVVDLSHGIVIFETLLFNVDRRTNPMCVAQIDWEDNNIFLE